MRVSEDRFRELQSRYFNSSESYSSDHPHYEKAKMVIIGVNTIERPHEKFREKYNDERHWYQQRFITKAINGILSSFLLTQNHFYDSAYRDIRSLLEIFLLLNHMNDNKIKTARVFLKQERNLENIESSPEKLSWRELYSEDKLHNMISEEKKRLGEVDDRFKKLYNFFSNRNVHPTRVDGVDLDQTYAKEEERQLLEWQIDFVLGTMVQLLKLYADTPDFQYLMNEITDLGQWIEDQYTPQEFIDIAIDEFEGVN